MKRKLLSLGALLCLTPFAVGQQEAEEPLAEQIRRKPTVGAMGIRETMGQIMARDAADGHDIPRWMRLAPNKPKMNDILEYDGSDTMNQSGWPNSNGLLDVPEPRYSIGASWLGADSSVAGAFPPDSWGAVGPTQVMVTVNGRFRIYSKAGVLSYNVSSNTFFTSVRGSSGTSDPRAYFDPLTNRWILGMINVSSPNRIMLAVSSGPTITNDTSFTFFQFTQDAIGTQPSADAGALFDYPCMGVDNNAVYFGGNMFGSGTPSVFVIRKSSILGAGPIVVKDFRQLGTSSIQTPYGVTNFDATATEGYFLGINGSATQVTMRRIGDPGGNPTISGAINVTVPTQASVTNYAPQGSTSPVDSLDRRFFTAQIKLNRITGTRTLWASHNTKVTNAGIGSGSGDRIGGRWYEIRNLTTTPTLTQSGTMFSTAATARHFNIPAITMNGQGHAAIASSTYGADLFASVGGSFRLRTDPVGTIETPSILQSSSTAYNAGFQTSRYRWGDYSQTVVDPTDDMTFWSFQEYCSNTNQWGLRVLQIRPPAPASVTLVSPTTIEQGETGNYTVIGTSVSGTEFFDPGAGFTNRLQASLSGTGLTVNSVSFTNPTTFVMNVTASGTATLGARNLTVTNPDGQTSVGNAMLTVTSSGAPVPTLTSISPISKVTLSPTFTLTVNGSNFVSTSKVQWNGSDRSTTFVNSGQLTATIDAIDLVSQGNFPVQVVTPAPGGGTSGSASFSVTRTTVNQSVDLLNHVAAATQPVTVELRNVGSTTPIVTFNPTLSGGQYSALVDIAPGTYDVAVKGATWLRQVAGSTVFGSATVNAAAVTLTNGDVNNDNIVDIADYVLLSNAFSATPSDGNWLAGADLNGDLIVDIADYVILASSFSLTGTP